MWDVIVVGAGAAGLMAAIRAAEAGRRTLLTRKVIITVGGQSYPGSGTTGDGYAIAAKFGHTIVPPRPALVPITVDVPWVAELRGVTLPDTGLRIIDGVFPPLPPALRG